MALAASTRRTPFARGTAPEGVDTERTPSAGHWRIGRAYRAGRRVCGCVHVTVRLDEHPGLTQPERRMIRVGFREPVDDDLRNPGVVAASDDQVLRRRKVSGCSREIAHTQRPLESIGIAEPTEPSLPTTVSSNVFELEMAASLWRALSPSAPVGGALRRWTCSLSRCSRRPSRPGACVCARRRAQRSAGWRDQQSRYTRRASRSATTRPLVLARAQALAQASARPRRRRRWQRAATGREDPARDRLVERVKIVVVVCEPWSTPLPPDRTPTCASALRPSARTAGRAVAGAAVAVELCGAGERRRPRAGDERRGLHVGERARHDRQRGVLEEFRRSSTEARAAASAQAQAQRRLAGLADHHSVRAPDWQETARSARPRPWRRARHPSAVVANRPLYAGDSPRPAQDPAPGALRAAPRCCSSWRLGLRARGSAPTAALRWRTRGRAGNRARG
jgi:hypothetical protein